MELYATAIVATDVLTYQWRQTDGPAVTLTDADTPQAQFAVPDEAWMELGFELTVTDAFGLESTAACAMQTVTAPRLAAGYHHYTIVTAGESLWAWGHNDEGQLGDGTTTDRLVPTLIGDGAD